MLQYCVELRNAKIAKWNSLSLKRRLAFYVAGRNAHY